MFRCQLCQQVVPPRTPAARRVLATRPRKYPYRARANQRIVITDTGKRKVIPVDDPGGAGHEIVQERLVCPGCAR